MIASIEGKILEANQDSFVIEVGGVGILVFIPMPVKDKHRVGERVFLYTHLVVREDSLSLFGFDSMEGRHLFNLLLGVNGVGPRLALAVLSTLSVDAIRRAVFHEQEELFSRVPGVGKRTAQKILMHLQDRIPAEAGFEAVQVTSDVDGEVLAALTTLGYSVVEAQAAIQTIPRETEQDVEIRLRLALQYFSKP